MSRTLSDDQGRLLGGVIAVMDLGHAQRWIESFSLEPNDLMAIVDNDGIVLARNPPLPAAMGKPTSPPPGYPPFVQMERTTMFWATSPHYHSAKHKSTYIHVSKTPKLLKHVPLLIPKAER
jgi:hypothetical protein